MYNCKHNARCAIREIRKEEMEIHKQEMEIHKEEMEIHKKEMEIKVMERKWKLTALLGFRTFLCSLVISLMIASDKSGGVMFL